MSHALVLADGAAPSRASLDAAWPGWDAGLDLVIAADGGARHATTLGYTSVAPAAIRTSRDPIVDSMPIPSVPTARAMRMSSGTSPT